MSYQKIADLISQSNNTVVFSGAGMSTESGLPDFRSANGLWKNRDPRLLASTEALNNNRREFYEFYQWRITNLQQVSPNQGHRILADWEKRGIIAAIITQNVDRLHQEAGSRKVIELHGNLRQVSCHACGSVFDSNILLASAQCSKCSGYLRPAVVLFGESLPTAALDESEELSANCSLFIVLGSSLEVSPANWFPQSAKHHGAKLVIINKTPTTLDRFADIVLHESIGKTLTMVDSILSSPR